MNTTLKKYPRTPHLSGSRLQPGDEDLSQIPFSEILGRNIVIEEKCDGANSAVSFDENGSLLLQSRGHYLVGGYRERHYNFMKTWANAHKDRFYEVLGSRYIMYGEWMYAKHSVFYDALPHYFLEFDVFDRETGLFLDTPSRQKLLGGLPIVSVPVLATGVFRSKEEIMAYLGTSKFISRSHMECLHDYCVKYGEDVETRCGETDPTEMMEGLYIKVEEDGAVQYRMKYVRASFSQAVDNSGTHWADRPIIPNQLARPQYELLLPELPVEELP